MIIGISGVAGSGKDTTADVLIQHHGFVKVALADPLKRICKDVYDFSDDQLWGPSASRNAPDWRYPRTPEAVAFIERIQVQLEERFAQSVEKEFGEDVAKHFLTTREALQSLGTEWGRRCFRDTWLQKAIRTAKTLLSEAGRTLQYDARRGLHESVQARAQGVAIPDVRFKNEMLGIRAAGGVVIRVRRTKAGLNAGFAAHASEAEQLDVPDEFFDYVAVNDSPLEELPSKVSEMLDALRRKHGVKGT